eukprot:scpid102345/ scgid29558/ 
MWLHCTEHLHLVLKTNRQYNGNIQSVLTVVPCATNFLFWHNCIDPVWIWTNATFVDGLLLLVFMNPVIAVAHHCSSNIYLVYFFPGASSKFSGNPYRKDKNNTRKPLSQKSPVQYKSLYRIFVVQAAPNAGRPVQVEPCCSCCSCYTQRSWSE